MNEIVRGESFRSSVVPAVITKQSTYDIETVFIQKIWQPRGVYEQYNLHAKGFFFCFQPSGSFGSNGTLFGAII